MVQESFVPKLSVRQHLLFLLIMRELTEITNAPTRSQTSAILKRGEMASCCGLIQAEIRDDLEACSGCAIIGVVTEGSFLCYMQLSKDEGVLPCDGTTQDRPRR